MFCSGYTAMRGIWRNGVDALHPLRDIGGGIDGMEPSSKVELLKALMNSSSNLSPGPSPDSVGRRYDQGSSYDQPCGKSTPEGNGAAEG